MANGTDVVNIENACTLTKSGGAAVQISGTLDNSGVVQVNDGALAILGGGDSGGTFTGAGVILFAGALQNLAATSTIDSLNKFSSRQTPPRLTTLAGGRLQRAATRRR